MKQSADLRWDEQARLLGFSLSEPITIRCQFTPALTCPSSRSASRRASALRARWRWCSSSAAHSRTSVGVAQLPKGAAIEIDFIFKAS